MNAEQTTPKTQNAMNQQDSTNTTPANGYCITWSHAQYMANVAKITDAREPLWPETWHVPTKEDLMRMARFDPQQFEEVMHMVMQYAKPHQIRAIKHQMNLGAIRGV